MLFDWLEPKMETRIMEVLELCEKEIDPIYSEFSRIINELKGKLQTEKDKESLLRLESLFVDRLFFVEIAYREGFKDGVGIRKDIDKMIVNE